MVVPLVSVLMHELTDSVSPIVWRPLDLVGEVYELAKVIDPGIFPSDI